MKVLIAVSLLLSSFTTLLAQSSEYSITLGPELPYKKRSTLSKIIGDDENGFYTLRRNLLSSKMNVVSYDHKLFERRNTRQRIDEDGEGLNYEDVIYFNNNLFLLASAINKEAKKNNLYIQSIDKSTLLLNDDRQLLASLDLEKMRKRKAGSFGYDISRDESKLLIYFDLPYKKGEKECFGLRVFDKDEGLVWEKRT